MATFARFNTQPWRMRDISRFRNSKLCENLVPDCRVIRIAKDFRGLRQPLARWVLAFRRRLEWQSDLKLTASLIKFLLCCPTANSSAGRHGKRQCLREN